MRATTQISYSQANPPLRRAPGIVGAGFHRLTAEPVPTTYANCRRDPVNDVKPAPRPNDNTTPGLDIGGGFYVRPIHRAPSPEYVRATTRYRMPGKPAPTTPGAGNRRGRFPPLTAEPTPTTYVNCRRDPVNDVKPAPRPRRQDTTPGLDIGGRVLRAQIPPCAVTGIRAGNDQISYARQTRPYTPHAGNRRGRFPPFDGGNHAHHIRQLPARPVQPTENLPPARHGLTPCRGRGRVSRAPIHRAPSPDYVPAITAVRMPGKPAPTRHAPGIVGAGFHRLTAEPTPTAYVNCRRDPVNHAKPAPPPATGQRRAGTGAGFTCADPPCAVTGLRARNHRSSYARQTRPDNSAP